MSLRVRGQAFLVGMLVGLPGAVAQSVSTITTTAQSNGTTLPFQRHVVRVGPAIAGEGELVAALQRQGTDGEGLDLFVSQDEGQNWTESLPVQDNFAERDCSDMLPDADGGGFSLVYGVESVSSDFQPDPNSTIVYLHYAVATDGSLSIDQGPVTIYQPGANEGYFRPSLAIDTTGALHVTASLLDDPGGVAEGTSTKAGIEPNYSFSWWESVSTNSGTTWSTPTELAAFGDSFGGGRVLAYGDNLMAIFDAYSVDYQGGYMTEPAGAGENWNAPQVIVSAGIYHAGAFSVTATPDGIVHLGYSDKPVEELWYTEFNGSSWSTADLIEPTGVWSNQPALSHDGETLTYAWNHYVTDTDNIIEEETRPPGGVFGEPITVDDTDYFKGYTSAIDQFIDGEPLIVLWSQDPEPPAVVSNIQCAQIDGITSGSSGADAGVGGADGGTTGSDAGSGGTGGADAGTGSTSVSFSDNFSECAAATEVSLSSDWTTSGTWDCDDGHARGETAGVALADTAAMGNTTVSVSVQLDSSMSAGVVGRDSNGSFYAGVIESTGSVGLIAVNNGTVTTLASVPETIASDTSYPIELVLTGFDPVSIQVLFNGATVINTTDSSASALSSGDAGLYNGSGGRAQFEDFVLTGTGTSDAGTGGADAGTGSSDAGTGTSDAGAGSSDAGTGEADAGTGGSDAGTGSTSVSFSDSFSECAATTEVSLSSDWTTSGTWDCDDGHARGETAGVALADTAAMGNTTVSVSVQLDSSTSAGVVGRDSNGSFYAAVIESTGSVDLISVNNGTVTTLASVPETIASDTSYPIELVLTGFDPVSIQVLFNGATVINTTDSSASALSSGEAGLYDGGPERAQFENFVLTGTSGPPTPPPPPPPVTSFSDTFADCTSTSLGPNWIITGTWYCEVTEQARGETAAGLALANANLPADQTVSVRVELTGAATGSGVVARANGTSFYLARILSSGTFEIDSVEAGTITPLASIAQSFAADTSYRVTLSVSLSSPVLLTGAINGTVLLATTDGSAGQLTSGSVGMYSGAAARTQYTSFTATSP